MTMDDGYRRRTLATAVAALAMLASTCTSDGEEPSEASADPTESSSPSPTRPVMDVGNPLDEAIDDYAASMGVGRGKVEIVEQEEVTWQDGSLGCPEAGLEYPQEKVNGYRVVLRVDGKKATYHSKEGFPPFRCEDPAPR